MNKVMSYHEMSYSRITVLISSPCSFCDVSSIPLNPAAVLRAHWENEFRLWCLPLSALLSLWAPCLPLEPCLNPNASLSKWFLRGNIKRMFQKALLAQGWFARAVSWITTSSPNQQIMWNKLPVSCKPWMWEKELTHRARFRKVDISHE